MPWLPPGRRARPHGVWPVPAIRSCRGHGQLSDYRPLVCRRALAKTDFLSPFNWWDLPKMSVACWRWHDGASEFWIYTSNVRVAMLGIVLAITAALCWGTGAVFARLGPRHIKASIGTLISMLSSLVLVGSLAIITKFDDVRSLSPVALGWFGLISVLNYMLGRRFNYSAIRYIGVTKATPLFATAPFLLLSWPSSFWARVLISPSFLAPYPSWPDFIW